MSDIVKEQDSRRIFIDTLIELAEKDDKIILIVPDVGFNYIEEFQKKFPQRYFNLGVTEQSVILVAAAMALDGWKPYVYSMINFVAFRPFEMVRNGIAFHNANVKLIGVKGSEKYKFLGFSHNMSFYNEDVHHLGRYISCYIPRTDGLEPDVREIIIKTYNKQVPTYIRL